MIYILLSILCSVAVAVLLKYAKRFPVAVEQIVNTNYAIAILLCFFIFKPDFQILQNSAPWKIYFPLWILLPSIFLFLAASIKSIGIAKTDIAQRLSLFIPILASFFIFHETIGFLKLTGLAVGFLAIFFTLHRNNSKNEKNFNLTYPLMVFLGFGIIDVLFKQIAATKEIPFTTSLFIIFSGAFVIATLISLFYIIKGYSRFQLKNIYWGILLGLLNFGNIFFYLKAHQSFAENPSTVFAAMNFGVIAFGSFIGVVAFEEKLSKINYAGIALALTAVIIITFSQLYV
ncbi:EamA/RhaT family transporter [Flavobacterium enshiense]|uniref:EamA/RhaT family transporter n=1 Tax=Flavobacterium enshiense TaxID=1341165 RepID=UPI00345CB716